MPAPVSDLPLPPIPHYDDHLAATLALAHSGEAPSTFIDNHAGLLMGCAPKGRPQMSRIYHEGNRRLQDQFDSRRIADRLEEVTARTAFTNNDKAFVESRMFFFLATATPQIYLRPAISRAARPSSCAWWRRTNWPFRTMTATACFSASAMSRPIPMSVSCSSTSISRAGCVSTARRVSRATIR